MQKKCTPKIGLKYRRIYNYQNRLNIQKKFCIPHYVKQHNAQVHSCNHFYHEKAINITYAKCVSVTLDIQHAKYMC
jgi:hypothetical protein